MATDNRLDSGIAHERDGDLRIKPCGHGLRLRGPPTMMTLLTVQ
jgi:hypothetical protein